MTAEEKRETDIKKLWERLEEREREIALYFAHAAQPVSVDALSSLSDASAVTVLNVMEKLKRKGLVSEKKGFGKGIFFLRDPGMAAFVRAQISDDEMRRIARRIVDYSAESQAEGTDRVLFLAVLYRKLGDSGEGLDLIKNAADILARSGQKAKATAHYDHILKYFSQRSPTSEQAGLFLDSVIGKIYMQMHRMPIHEQVPLLTKAQEIAQRYEMWDRVARISLRLGRALQDAGQHKRASKYVHDFLSLSRKIGDPGMLKATSHSLSEYYAFRGEHAEATRCYEEMVGNLEEFGDDEEVLMASQLVGFSHAHCGRISRGLGMIDAVRIKADLLKFHQVVNYCDQASVIVLLTIRRIPEAEGYVSRLSSHSDEELGPVLAWALCDHKAFILCSKQDYEGAFEYVKKGVEHSHSIGRTHNHYAWNFETLNILESKGYFCDEMNLDGLIERALNWDDVHMKGVALRYRALRSVERHKPRKRILSDLLNSEKHLRRSGAEIELARTRIALGRYFLKNREAKSAHAYLSKAWEFFSTIDGSLFPMDLLDVMPQEQKVELMVERVTKINESLGTIRDMSSFLERVINVAMDFTMAMRGAFVERQSDSETRILASRNLDPALFNTEKFKQVREFIEGTISRGVEIVLPQPAAGGNGQAGASIICMPAKLGEEIMGYLCLDGRVGDEPFPANRIPVPQDALQPDRRGPVQYQDIPGAERTEGPSGRRGGLLQERDGAHRTRRNDRRQIGGHEGRPRSDTAGRPDGQLRAYLRRNRRRQRARGQGHPQLEQQEGWTLYPRQPLRPPPRADRKRALRARKGGFYRRKRDEQGQVRACRRRHDLSRRDRRPPHEHSGEAPPGASGRDVRAPGKR